MQASSPFKKQIIPMRKVLLTCFVLAGALLFSYAQPPQRGGQQGRMSPEDRAKRTVEDLEKSLKLTKQQQDSVYAYSLTQAKEQQALFQQGQDGDRQAMMGKMREIRANTDKKIRTILNDDQKAAYDKLMKERQNRQGPGNRGGRQQGEGRQRN